MTEVEKYNKAMDKWEGDMPKGKQATWHNRLLWSCQEPSRMGVLFEQGFLVKKESLRI